MPDSFPKKVTSYFRPQNTPLLSGPRHFPPPHHFRHLLLPLILLISRTIPHLTLPSHLDIPVSHFLGNNFPEYPRNKSSRRRNPCQSLICHCHHPPLRPRRNSTRKNILGIGRRILGRVLYKGIHFLPHWLSAPRMTTMKNYQMVVFGIKPRCRGV